MSQRFKLYSIVIAIGFLLIVTVLTCLSDLQYIRYIEQQKNNRISSIDEYSKSGFMQPLASKLRSTSLINATNVEKIIEKTRSKIKLELSTYNFLYSGVRKLEDLLVEAGGKPIISVVFSSWRSGSTFFGEMLESISGTYYHYEPLLKYGIVQIRDPPKSNEALVNIKKHLKCDFDGLEDYFEFGKTDLIQFRQNTRLWEYCKHNRHLCFDPDFTSRFCKLFPFQVMKLCRMRLRFAQELLDDTELNVKVILLVRDPRGVFNSRRHRYFCQTGLDCWQPELLCADMIRDYITASRLLPLYPDRLMVIRFEDLALHPHHKAHRILKFLKLNATLSTEEFLKSHTNDEVAGFDSTFRVSRKIPFKWKYLMDFKDVQEIQLVCKEAMRMWGYRMAHNATQMMSEEFNPIANYTVQYTYT